MIQSVVREVTGAGRGGVDFWGRERGWMRVWFVSY